MINKVNHKFSNTCGMDSLLEILIVATIDNLKVENLISQLQAMNTTMNLVLFIKQNGVKEAYLKRGIILKELINNLDKKKITSYKNSIFVECSINAFYLSQKLFENLPQSQICRKCLKCGQMKKYLKREFLLNNSFLENPRSERSLFNFFEPDKSCSKCLGIVTSTYESSGKIKEPS